MQIEEIQLEGISLRKVDEQVLNFAFNNYQNGQLCDFLGVENHDDLNIEKEKFRRGFSTFNKRFLFFHLLVGSDKQNIGWCGFHTWYVDHDRAEIGYTIFDEQHRNKGYMSEVLPYVIDYGFKMLNLNRIEAFVAPYNTPSLQLLKRAGFQREGTLKQHYKVNGRHEDSLLFALLKENQLQK